MPRRWAALFAVLGACAGEPDVEDPGGGGADAGLTYADVVIAYTESGLVTTCEASGCSASGPCTQHPAVGAPDGDSFTLEPAGRLEVGFLCSTVLERGGMNSADLRIHATLTAGATALVSVSVDGSTYVDLGPINASSTNLDLARAELTDARFVRIIDGGSGGFEIDAVEALR